MNILKEESMQVKIHLEDLALERERDLFTSKERKKGDGYMGKVTFPLASKENLSFEVEKTGTYYERRWRTELQDALEVVRKEYKQKYKHNEFRMFTDKYVFYGKKEEADKSLTLYCYDQDKIMEKLAKEQGLPEHCYAIDESTKEPILIQYGRNGNVKIESLMGFTVDRINYVIGVDDEAKKRMELGSIYGWESKEMKDIEKQKMQVTIYQVDLEKDKNNVAFRGLGELPSLQENGMPDAKIYEKVYEGRLIKASLDDLYTQCNIPEKYPKGYKGRSMSVSDLVEIKEGKDNEEGLFFCNVIGFSKVADSMEDLVNKEKCKDTIRVLMVEPDKEPYVKEIAKNLTSYQREVDGYIEAAYPFEDEVAVICNEEGKLLGLPFNRALRDEEGKPYDIIAGNFMVVGLEEDSFGSLKDEYIEKYTKVFANDEKFVESESKVFVYKKDKEETKDMEELKGMER